MDKKEGQYLQQTITTQAEDRKRLFITSLKCAPGKKRQSHFLFTVISPEDKLKHSTLVFNKQLLNNIKSKKQFQIQLHR